jgi:hypothetical protein
LMTTIFTPAAPLWRLLPASDRAAARIVDFEDFGASSLNFKLYAHIADLTKAGGTRTDLRIAILDAFNEAGIVFPFPQTEVTIRDMDWLRAAIARGHNGRGAENGNPASRHVPGPMQSSERIVGSWACTAP